MGEKYKIKIRTELNEIEKKKLYKNYCRKELVFEVINTNDKPLATLSKKRAKKLQQSQK